MALFAAHGHAAAVRQDSPKLQAAIDQTLARLETSGELDALIVEHFGEDAVEKK